MRYLLINADDFGIGPATSEGILQLAQRGLLSSSVLMVNSPYAQAAVQAWQAAGGGRTLELGWHPVLTNDAPILPASQVSSLVDPTGKFHGLHAFMQRWFLGKIDVHQVWAEFSAQYDRCVALLGGPPGVINTHHHVQVFRPVGTILKDIVCRDGRFPYLRLVREPWPMIWKVPGARGKRLFLNWLGRRAARRQRLRGLVGNDWLIGVTNPGCVNDPDFFIRLVRAVSGNVVELSCHPGLADPTLIGRDCTADDGMMGRRVREMELLADPRFAAACRQAGFTIIRPSQLAALYHRGEEPRPAGDAAPAA